MSRRLNVDRMRRHQRRPETRAVTCPTCRDLFRRMDATPDFTVARFAIGAEHFGHVLRDHKTGPIEVTSVELSPDVNDVIAAHYRAGGFRR